MAASTRTPKRRHMSRREWSMRERCNTWGVPYTQVSRARVFARSGWRCALCGDPVDKSLRFPNPASKSLDHVIPLSVPGSPGHVFANCQLAHLGCNARKGGVNRM